MSDPQQDPPPSPFELTAPPRRTGVVHIPILGRVVPWDRGADPNRLRFCLLGDLPEEREAARRMLSGAAANDDEEVYVLDLDDIEFI